MDEENSPRKIAERGMPPQETVRLLVNMTKTTQLMATAMVRLAMESPKKLNQETVHALKAAAEAIGKQEQALAALVNKIENP